ncbi:hypothetical protein [Flavobacterium beibuense]|uniref:Uncharacterized protein n=1 Tax=Flavobacterium beibuense F44-8 TaxID=1406840 RepID=A0A0A2LKH3_9FLAO|nr:hypothetical protein [Flavobacterium beibuense]KGO79653.1 hypothetical protein Q763_12440 [Flavobacterium beibuense F44-8]
MYRYVFFVLCIAISFSVNAQNYPKYKTTRVKDTVFTQPEKTDDIIIAETQLAEEPKSEFDELFEKARQLAVAKEFKQAITIFNEALVISPPENEYLVLLLRGNCYFSLKEFDQCISDYTRALEETKLPHENAKGNLCMMRGLAYGSRDGEGDKERKCADIAIARATGALGGDRSVLDADCD